MTTYYYNTKGLKTHWSKTELKDILETMEEGDVLETGSPTTLACSTAQVLEIFTMVCAKGLEVEFAMYRGNMNSEISNIALLKLCAILYYFITNTSILILNVLAILSFYLIRLEE